MNKARKKTHKTAKMKRLVKESFVLSSTSSLSSRIVRFFETGPAASLFTSVDRVDSFVHESVSEPLNEKHGIRNNITKPIRNTIASFLSRNSLMKALSSIRVSMLKTSLRSIGVLLITFAVYSAVAFLLKRYVPTIFGNGSINDLFVSSVSLLTGIVLAVFGEKSVISSLGSSRSVGILLSECLGINDSVFSRYQSKPTGTALGVSFLIGSTLGVLTVFYSPLSVLVSLFLLIVLVSILNIPEFGLLLTVLSFTFLPTDYTSSLVVLTFSSYLIKCIRLKRNFRFGTADAIMLVAIAIMLIGGAFSAGTFSEGEEQIIIFAAIYFLAKNLICSEKLVIQSFNALCAGGSIGMALYILGEYAFLIDNVTLRDAVLTLTSNVLETDTLVMLASVTVPIALTSCFGLASKRFGLTASILALACAFVADSYVFGVLVLCSVFVFVAFSFKAFGGALISAIIALPPLFALFSGLASSSLAVAGANTGCDLLLGLPLDATYSNFFEGFGAVFGTLAVILFCFVGAFSFQRACGSLVLNSSARTSLISGAVSASFIVMTVNMLCFNIMSDVRVMALVWFVYGLCGSVYKVGKVNQYKTSEV